MAHSRTTSTFKLAKWVLKYFDRLNIKIRGLKENQQVMSKRSLMDMVIERVVHLECAYTDFKVLCEKRYVKMEVKVNEINYDIKKILLVSHTSVRNSVNSLEFLLKKLGELMEDQIFFAKIYKKD